MTYYHWFGEAAEAVERFVEAKRGMRELLESHITPKPIPGYVTDRLDNWARIDWAAPEWMSY